MDGRFSFLESSLDLLVLLIESKLVPIPLRIRRFRFVRGMGVVCGDTVPLPRSSVFRSSAARTGTIICG